MRSRLTLIVAALVPLALPAGSPARAEDGAPVRLARDDGPGGPGYWRPRFERPLYDGPRSRRPLLDARDERPAFPPPPPPLPPTRLEVAPSPPPYFSDGGGGLGQEDSDVDVNDPAKFVAPPWLPDWIRVARDRGYSDEELAVILERHPRLGRFIRRCRLAGFKDKEIYAAMGLSRWHQVPAYANSRPIPLPPSRTGQADPASAVPVEQPAAQPTAAVSLDVPDTLRAEDGEVDVTGRLIGDIKGASVFVDGAQVSLGRDGGFHYRRGVPIGSTEIKVEAHDRQGRATEAYVTVSRDQPSAASVAGAYEPLNPRKAKGRPHPNAVALIIGIDKYESSPRAEFAENDANAFYDYAVRSLGVPRDRIKLMTGPQARRLAVEKALLAWAQPLIAQGQSDVYVFFSGHGLASDDGKEQYLLPYDAERSLLGQSAIKRRDVIDTLVGAGAHSVTLFLDTCYSGGTRGEETLVQAARPILLSVKEGSVPSNVTILAAASHDQLSSSLAGARHGLFSYYLMKGLEGAAAEGNTITASGLEAWLMTQVPAEAAKLGRSQTPELLGDSGRVLATW